MSITSTRLLSHGVVAGLTVLALAACHMEEMPVPGEPVPGEPGPPPAEAQVTVPVSSAAHGTALPIEATGFPANTHVRIGLGQPASDYDVVTETTTDAQGRVDTTIQVPDWTMEGHPYVVVVAAPGDQPRAVSDPFVVASGGETVQVHGTVTDEGVECPAVRDRAGTLYTLAGADADLEPGTEVTVEGRIAEVSICMQGVTIEVESIQQR
jgi:hypothetical protein